MNSYRIVKHIRAALCAVATLCFSIQSSAADSKPIRIGALLHLTGDLAPQGAAMREGIELAVAEVNSQAASPTIEAMFEDTALKPAQAYKAAKKLLEVDEIVAGLVSTSAETKSAATLFQRKQIPLISLWDSSPTLEALGRNVFGIGTWTPSAGEKVAQHIFNSLHLRRAAIINNIDEWSLEVSDAFSEQFQALGGTLTATESINPENSDFRSTITRIKRSNPDALYAPLGFNTASFFKQLRQLGFNKPIYVSDLINKEIIEAAGRAVEGVYQSQTGDPSGTRYSRMEQLYQKQFGRPLSMPIFTAWGYDAVHLLAQAFTASAGDPLKASEQLYRVKNYDGASGTISISAQGSSRRSVSLFQVQNGSLVAIEK